MPGRTGARRCATQPIKFWCTFFMCVVYSWYLHPLCTVCTTIAPRVLHFNAVHIIHVSLIYPKMHVVCKKSNYLLLFITDQDCSESIICSIDRAWVTVCDNNWDMYRVCHITITIVGIQELITKQTGEHTNYILHKSMKNSRTQSLAVHAVH